MYNYWLLNWVNYSRGIVATKSVLLVVCVCYSILILTYSSKVSDILPEIAWDCGHGSRERMHSKWRPNTVEIWDFTSMEFSLSVLRTAINQSNSLLQMLYLLLSFIKEKSVRWSCCHICHCFLLWQQPLLQYHSIEIDLLVNFTVQFCTGIGLLVNSTMQHCIVISHSTSHAEKHCIKGVTDTVLIIPN